MNSVLPTPPTTAPEGDIKETGSPKKSYEQIRMEKEEVKVAKMVTEAKAAEVKAMEARGHKEQRVAGPITKHEALLIQQREQRHMILSYLRKPWPVYDEDAGELMEMMGRLALEKLNHDAAGNREGEKVKA